MNRCEHCRGRSSWDCDDPYYRVSERSMCDNFDLDFSTLNDKQKKAIQKILMNEDKQDYESDDYYYIL